MYDKEHEPAHFHAEYQGRSAKFAFDGELIVGNITSRTALREWALLHNAERKANWIHMKAGESLERIAPLE